MREVRVAVGRAGVAIGHVDAKGNPGAPCAQRGRTEGQSIEELGFARRAALPQAAQRLREQSAVVRGNRDPMPVPASRSTICRTPSPGRSTAAPRLSGHWPLTMRTGRPRRAARSASSTLRRHLPGSVVETSRRGGPRAAAMSARPSPAPARRDAGAAGLGPPRPGARRGAQRRSRSRTASARRSNRRSPTRGARTRRGRRRPPSADSPAAARRSRSSRQARRRPGAGRRRAPRRDRGRLGTRTRAGDGSGPTAAEHRDGAAGCPLPPSGRDDGSRPLRSYAGAITAVRRNPERSGPSINRRSAPRGLGWRHHVGGFILGAFVRSRAGGPAIVAALASASVAVGCPRSPGADSKAGVHLWPGDRRHPRRRLDPDRGRHVGLGIRSRPSSTRGAAAHPRATPARRSTRRGGGAVHRHGERRRLPPRGRGGDQEQGGHALRDHGTDARRHGGRRLRRRHLHPRTRRRPRARARSCPLRRPVPAPAPSKAPPPTLLRPFPVVRIRGYFATTGARITLLAVRGPRSARITVRCIGKGCPVASARCPSAPARLHPFERFLRAGTRLEVSVGRPGRIGKYTSFPIRAHRKPLRTDRCLMPGRSKPTRCPAS